MSSNQSASGTALTFPDIPESDRRFGSIKETDDYPDFSTADGVLYRGGEPVLEIFSTPRVIEPGETGYVYIVGHTDTHWQWDWVLKGHYWVHKNVLQRDHFETAGFHGDEGPWLKPMRAFGPHGTRYIEHMGLGKLNKTEPPYEIRIKIEPPEGMDKRREGWMGGLFTFGKLGVVPGKGSASAAARWVVDPEGVDKPSLIELAAGGDGRVDFNDVLRVIGAFNEGDTLASRRVEYGDVLDVIQAYNEGGDN